MGIVVSYDDRFGMPSSEIRLDSGEHVSLTLDKNGLVIKALARPGNLERILFAGKPDVIAEICASLVDERSGSTASPLQILVSAVTNIPDTAAVKRAFEGAVAAR